MKTVLIIGAGFSGAVVARQLAEKGNRCEVREQRSHVAGNCHTERDPETGVMVHKYGPHIFHTDDAEVWKLMNTYGQMMPFTFRVKSTVGGQVYSMPINLHTINQFYGESFSPQEAEKYLKEKVSTFPHAPRNFQEQALSMVGPDLYEAFFKGYTTKQWGLSPTALPASIFSRLPVRYTYNDNYFFHPHQGIPRHGYTRIIENLLEHRNISLSLNTAYQPGDHAGYEHTFYAGPLDAYFRYTEGRLSYRTLDFQETRHKGDYLGTPMMNYGDINVPHTRITEHKFFTPWENHAETIISTEYSRQAAAGDTPYYPIRLAEDKAQLSIYERLAKAEKNVTFMGRLGTYRYLDMDKTIREALDHAETFLRES